MCSLAVVSGAVGVAEWSIALATAMPFALLAEAAGWAGERARGRTAGRVAATEAASRYRFVSPAAEKPERDRRAA